MCFTKYSCFFFLNPTDKVIHIYNEMKVMKTNTVPNRRIRLTVFEIKGVYTDVEHVYREEFSIFPYFVLDVMFFHEIMFYTFL